VVFLADGRFVGQLDDPTAETVAERMTRLGAWDPARTRHSSQVARPGSGRVLEVSAAGQLVTNDESGGGLR
jgi:hypothetical protein